MLILGLAEVSGVEPLVVSLGAVAAVLAGTEEAGAPSPLDVPFADDGEDVEPPSLANRLLRILSASEVESDMLTLGWPKGCHGQSKEGRSRLQE